MNATERSATDLDYAELCEERDMIAAKVEAVRAAYHRHANARDFEDWRETMTVYDAACAALLDTACNAAKPA